MRSLKNNVNKIMEPKALDCAGLPGDLISFQAKNLTTGIMQKYDGSKIIETYYQVKDLETHQPIFISHSKLDGRIRAGNPNWGLYTLPKTPPEPAESFSVNKSSKRLPTILEESTTPPPSGPFANIKSSFSLFGGPSVKNPLSAVPPKGGKTRRKRSKRRKTIKR
jgi:hypothetical protein